MIDTKAPGWLLATPTNSEADRMADEQRQQYSKRDPWRDHWREFQRRVERRLISGHHEYGGRSFSRTSTIELIEEICAELEDIAGWCLPLWARLRCVRHELEYLGASEPRVANHHWMPGDEPGEEG